MRRALEGLDETAQTNQFHGASKDEVHLWFKRIKTQDKDKMGKYFSIRVDGLAKVSVKCSRISRPYSFKDSVPLGALPLVTKAALEEKYSPTAPTTLAPAQSAAAEAAAPVPASAHSRAPKFARRKAAKAAQGDPPPPTDTRGAGVAEAAEAAQAVQRLELGLAADVARIRDRLPCASMVDVDEV